MTGSQTERLAVAAIVLAIVLCWALTFRGHGHDWGGDFSLYVAHARNIAEGRPYSAVNYIAEKTVYAGIPPQGPPTYPPVFPAVLAPAVGLFGLDYGPMRALVQTLWLLSGALFFLYARRRGLGLVESAAIVGVFLLSSMVLGLKDSIVSESTYLAITAATLLLFDRIYRSEAAPRPVLYGVAAGLLLLAASLTRATGVVLVAAFGVHELYRLRRIRLFAVVAGLTFVAGYLAYRLTLYDGAGYANQFRLTPGIWAGNVVQYTKSSASLWSPLPAAVRYPAALVVLALAGFGLARKFSRGPSVAEFYVVLYMIPLLLYSSGANTRYILPVYPLILLYCAESLKWVGARMPAYSRRPAFAALGAFLLAGAAANVAAIANAPDPDGPETATFQEAAQWIRTNVPAADTVVSWNPRVVALYTRRTSAFYPPVDDPGVIRARMDEVKAKWLLRFVRSEADARWLAPYMDRDAERFARVWANTDFAIYRVRRDGVYAQQLKTGD